MKYVIVFILGILSYPLLFDAADAYYSLHRESKIARSIWSKLINTGYGTQRAFIGDCTKDVDENGHGWIFIRRDYFQCNKLEVKISNLIYGEYAEPRDLEKERKICKDCTF